SLLRDGRLAVLLARCSDGDGGFDGGLLFFARAHLLAFDDCVSNLRSEETNGAQRIVVAGYYVVDAVGIAVRVDDRDYGNTEAIGFGYGDLFLLGIDDEDDIGQFGHLFDARKVLLKRLTLAFKAYDLFLGQSLVTTVGLHRFEILQSANRALNRLEIG